MLIKENPGFPGLSYNDYSKSVLETFSLYCLKP